MSLRQGIDLDGKTRKTSCGVFLIMVMDVTEEGLVLFFHGKLLFGVLTRLSSMSCTLDSRSWRVLSLTGTSGDRSALGCCPDFSVTDPLCQYKTSFWDLVFASPPCRHVSVVGHGP